MPLTSSSPSMLGHATPDEAAQAAIIGSETLTEPCQILRRTAQRDGAGGFTYTWAVVQTTTCSIPKSLALQELERTGQVSAVARFRAWFPAGTDLRNADRVDVAGDRYEVIGTDRGVTGPSLLNATLARIGEGQA